jgi:hypothetical protein
MRTEYDFSKIKGVKNHIKSICDKCKRNCKGEGEPDTIVLKCDYFIKKKEK